MLASSLIGLAVSGRKAIGPRIPGRPERKGNVWHGGRAVSVADVAAGEGLALQAVRLGDISGTPVAVIQRL